MHTRLIAFLMFLSSVVLLAVMQTTTPSKVGPIVIVAVFVLIYLSLACFLALLFAFVNKIVRILNSGVSGQSAYDNVHTLMYGAVFALAPTVIIAMRSVGQVQVGAYVLVAIFVVIVFLYIRLSNVN